MTAFLRDLCFAAAASLFAVAIPLAVILVLE